MNMLHRCTLLKSAELPSDPEEVSDKPKPRNQTGPMNWSMLLKTAMVIKDREE